MIRSLIGLNIEGPVQAEVFVIWLDGDRAADEEVVEATVEHGRRLHHMVATRDDVLAMAVAADERAG